MNRARQRRLKRRRAHGRSPAGSPGRKRTDKLKAMGARTFPAGDIPVYTRAHVDEEQQSLWKGIISRPNRERLRILAYNVASRRTRERLGTS